MTFPVLLEICNDQFSASLVGAPTIQAAGPTRSRAVDALKLKIERHINLGELLCLEVDTVGVSTLASKYSSDVTLRKICDDAYELRDDERQ